jgi:hypothetical protein
LLGNGALAGFAGFLSVLKKRSHLREPMMVKGFAENVSPCIAAAHFICLIQHVELNRYAVDGGAAGRQAR